MEGGAPSQSQQQQQEGPPPSPSSPPSSLTLVDESISLSIRCGGRGEDEILVAIPSKDAAAAVKVHEAFLRATFKRAAKGTNLRLLDQRGRMHHPVVYPPPSSCQCHGEEAARSSLSSSPSACFELPREGLCYELLFDEQLNDDHEKKKEEEPKKKPIPLLLKGEAAITAARGEGNICRAAAPPSLQRQQYGRRLDLSGGEHGEGGHRMYIAPNGTRVISSVPAEEGCGIANLFSQSRGKYYFMATETGGKRDGHLTFEFPRPVRVTRIAIRSHVPGLGAVGGNIAAVFPRRCRSNYSVLLWEKGVCGGSWTEAVPLVDTADHPAPGIETVHDETLLFSSSDLGGENSSVGSFPLIDRLRIFLTSEGDDAGVALGSVAIYFAAPSPQYK